MDVLDLSSLTKAIDRLGEGLALHHADPESAIIRDGLIHRFEFTYDLAHKMLARVLTYMAPAGESVAQMSLPTLIRSATEKGLIGDTWIEWSGFRNKRNTTSHTYDEDKAREVAAAIPAFYDSARHMLGRLQQLTL